MQKTGIFAIIKRKLLEVLPDLEPAAIVPEESMRNLGANSIDRVDVVIETMEELRLNIPLSQLGHIKNLQELVDFFHERMGAETS